MSRPVIQILWALADPKSFRAKVRFHKAHAEPARAECDLRALAAGWDPEGPIWVETTTETKNWLTEERGYYTPLSIQRALQLNAADLPMEQEMVRNNADRIGRMVAAREAYNAGKAPLFAAAGALDEVAGAPHPLGYTLGQFEAEMTHAVQDATDVQRTAQARAAIARRIGADALAELDAHQAASHWSRCRGYGWWADAARDPEKALATARELTKLRQRPAMAVWRCVRASASICFPEGSPIYARLKTVSDTLPDDEVRLHFWRQIRDREEARRKERLAAGQDPAPWRDPRGPVEPAAPLVQLELRLAG